MTSRRAVGLGYTVLVALVLGVFGAPAANAHGVLRASDPADRAVLEQAPAAVTLSFTEAPEARLSSVQVLDRTGASFAAGDVAVMAGDPETLRVELRPLPRGVYTVNWRIVSRVDGHLTAGTVAFGVQEPVTADALSTSEARAPTPSNRSPGAVGGRVLLYAGILLLLGVAWTGVALFEQRRDLLGLAGAGWVVATAGVVALGVAQRSSTGASLGVFLGTRLGHSLLWRAAGLALAAAGLVLARRRWRTGMGLVAAGTVAVVVAHVESGHAAAGSWPWALVGLQGVHVVAMAVWIGGLAALLMGVRAPRRAWGAWRPSRAKEAVGAVPDGAPAVAGGGSAGDVRAAGAVRRFSAVAGVAIATLAVTGVVRAVDAVQGWGPLWDSGYGRLILAKAALLVILGGLGAVNRFRHVPAAGRSLTGLRRVGITELAVAAAALAVTGFLTTSPPPSTARVRAPDVVLTASDFGTTVKARLTVSPAQPGNNRFGLRVADYDSGDPIAADRVTARFTLPAFPAAAPSTLVLAPTEPGTFVASGTNLSLPGRWTIAIVIERGDGSLELTMELATRTTPPPVTVAGGGAQPTISTATIVGGRMIQVYVDPERPGPTELHLTFFTAAGQEEAMDSTSVVAGGTAAPTPRRLGPGHFVVDVTAPDGPWAVEVTAVTAAGDYVYIPLDLEIST